MDNLKNKIKGLKDKVDNFDFRKLGTGGVPTPGGEKIKKLIRKFKEMDKRALTMRSPYKRKLIK